HVWDLNPDVDVWLEVAAYDPTADADSDPTNGLQIRETLSDGNPANGEWAIVWGTGAPGGTDLSGSLNYEWTKEIVPLTGFAAGDTVSYRFVIESNGSSSGRKQWFVDDINIGNENLPDLSNESPAPADTFTVCNDITTCESYWDLNDTAQAADFRSTGRWAITSNAGAVSGMAWEDDPGGPYSLESGASDRLNEPGANRIYWIEFDRRLDLRETVTVNTNGTADLSDDSVTYNSATASLDPDEDDGPPQLTFFQTYDLRDDARLELQYFDDATDTWRLLHTIESTGSNASAASSRQDVHFYEIPLHLREDPTDGTFDGYADGWTDWATKPIRVRFAMIVEADATTTPSAVGWTLDNILIERLGQVDFTPYPLYDSGGDGVDATVSDSRNRWIRNGLWEIGTART
ncbi:MAG: hypothetical protein AAF125_25725, partial [Chloroflexota bacterium]